MDVKQVTLQIPEEMYSALKHLAVDRHSSYRLLIIEALLQVYPQLQNLKQEKNDGAVQ